MRSWERRGLKRRNLSLPLLWPGFHSRTWRHIWDEFFVEHRPFLWWFFSGSTGFPPSKKTHEHFKVPIKKQWTRRPSSWINVCCLTAIIVINHFMSRIKTVGLDKFGFCRQRNIEAYITLKIFFILYEITCHYHYHKLRSDVISKRIRFLSLVISKKDLGRQLSKDYQ